METKQVEKAKPRDKYQIVKEYRMLQTLSISCIHVILPNEEDEFRSSFYCDRYLRSQPFVKYGSIHCVDNKEVWDHQCKLCSDKIYSEHVSATWVFLNEKGRAAIQGLIEMKCGISPPIAKIIMSFAYDVPKGWLMFCSEYCAEEYGKRSLFLLTQLTGMLCNCQNGKGFVTYEKTQIA